MVKYEAERLNLQFEYFEKALQRLKEALAEEETSFVRDSIVQRFELTFEMAWKAMFRHLTDKGARIGFKSYLVLPEAFEADLIADAGVWDRMREYRNDTSHEYNEAKAIEIAAFVRRDAIHAFEDLAVTMREQMKR